MLNMSGEDVKQGLASYNEMCDLYLVYGVMGNHTALLGIGLLSSFYLFMFNF